MSEIKCRNSKGERKVSPDSTVGINKERPEDERMLNQLRFLAFAMKGVKNVRIKGENRYTTITIRTKGWTTREIAKKM